MVATPLEAAAQVLETKGLEVSIRTCSPSARASEVPGGILVEINTRSDADEKYRGTLDL